MEKQIAGTDSSNANALRWAAEVLRGRFAEILRLRDAALDSEDIEGVHKMRVAIRRLRSALRDFSALLEKQSLRESKKDLKRLADALGAARDEDVAIAALEKLHGKAKHESVRKAVGKMIEKRRAVREKAQAGLLETLAPAEIEALGERFSAALDEVVEKGGQASALTPREAGREVIANSLLREFCDLSESLYDPFEIERLHELRIAAKRLRYAVELFDVVWNGQLAPFAEELAQMQTHLGELHDADLWIEDLSRRLRKTKDKKQRADFWLLSRFTRQRTKHYRAALRLWGKWQKNNFINNLRAVSDNSPKSEKTSGRQ